MSDSRDLVLTTVQTVLDKNEDILLANNINRAAFERVALNAFLTTPDLAKCSRPSLIGAITKSVQYGLLPDAVSGVIIPMAGKAEFWPMIGGLLTKVRADPAMKSAAIGAQAAYDGEEFEDQRGTDPKITHRIPRGVSIQRIPDNLIAVYATCFFPGNPIPEFEVLYHEDLKLYKTYQRARKGLGKNWTEWAEVRVLKLLLKRLPVAPTLRQILADDMDSQEIDEGDDTADRPAQTTRRARRQQRREPEPEVIDATAQEVKPDPRPEPPPPEDDDPGAGADDTGGNEPYALDF